MDSANIRAVRKGRGKLRGGHILERKHLLILPDVVVSFQFLHQAPGPLDLVHGGDKLDFKILISRVYFGV
jgi:hypothetical protein